MRKFAIALLCAALMLPAAAQDVRTSSSLTEAAALPQALNFEGQQAAGPPIGWIVRPQGTAVADDKVIHSGHWAARLERKADSEGTHTTMHRIVAMDFSGNTITFHGFLRTEEVSGFAGLWLREDGECSGVLAFDNMQSRQLSGTSGWTEYSIELPLHADATQIVFGVLLAGSGKVWADDLQLLVDGKPVSDLPRGQVQRPKAEESGKFLLHKFAQRIGTECYAITRHGDTLSLDSQFDFKDRGTDVSLKASLRAARDYSPQMFTIAGKTCRFCSIDSSVELSGGSAQIRRGKETRAAPPPEKFFTISGYAPVAMQMAMVRYWRGHGSPPVLSVLPAGQIHLQDRGSESFDLDGRTVALERYSVRGLIWGLETLWMDSDNNLVALISTDAEFDHFEAMREGYEKDLSKFIAAAARDEMANLTELSAKFAAPRTHELAVVGATVIDGTGKSPLKDATVLVSGGKIVAVGPSARVKVPKDAVKIDAAGKYIIPGLWDMHAHYEQVEWGPIYLAAGVTTARDVFNEYDFITTVRDLVNSGKALGPRLVLAGGVDGDGPRALGMQRVNSPADAQAWVQRYHDAGFQQIKIYSSVTPENVRAICSAAHKLGMTVTGHIPTGMTAYDGVNAGMDQINHVQYIIDLLQPKDLDDKKATPEQRWETLASIDVNSEAVQRAVGFLKEHGTVVDPTMVVYEMQFRSADQPATNIEPGIAKVSPELREPLISGGVPPNLAPSAQKIRKKEVEIIGALRRAGVPVVAGTDQTVPGYSLYRELELYVEAGFTPMEALQAATLVPARVMKMETDSGTVEVGKRADFDILDANPLDDIHNIRSVRSVVANGVLYQSGPLWESVGFAK